jgi:hypothetical protein
MHNASTKFANTLHKTTTSGTTVGLLRVKTTAGFGGNANALWQPQGGAAPRTTTATEEGRKTASPAFLRRAGSSDLPMLGAFASPTTLRRQKDGLELHQQQQQDDEQLIMKELETALRHKKKRRRNSSLRARKGASKELQDLAASAEEELLRRTRSEGHAMRETYPDIRDLFSYSTPVEAPLRPTRSFTDKEYDLFLQGMLIL